MRDTHSSSANCSRNGLPDASTSARWKSRLASKECWTSGISARWVAIAARMRSTGAPRSAAMRAAPGSITSRASVGERMSAPWMSATRAPRLVCIWTSPSAASRRSASRTGVRETPSSAARSSWCRRLPRASSPEMIRARMAT